MKSAISHWDLLSQTRSWRNTLKPLLLLNNKALLTGKKGAFPTTATPSRTELVPIQTTKVNILHLNHTRIRKCCLSPDSLSTKPIVAQSIDKTTADNASKQGSNMKCSKLVKPDS